MEFILLADNSRALSTIANWYHEEWGHISDADSGKRRSVAALELKRQDYLNRDKLPLIVLAMEADTVVGAAQLRSHEMDIYPEREHWLGGVYIKASHRGLGIGQAMIEKVIVFARQFYVSRISLQTEDNTGGLYAKLGWQAVERVTYHNVDVLVMEIPLGDFIQDTEYDPGNKLAYTAEDTP